MKKVGKNNFEEENKDIVHEIHSPSPYRKKDPFSKSQRTSMSGRSSTLTKRKKPLPFNALRYFAMKIKEIGAK
jgi:hypothetical protein